MCCTGRRLLFLLLLSGEATAAEAQEPALQAKVLFAQDFTAAPLGPPPWPIMDNSGWAGSTVPTAVVDSGDPRYGRLLECRVAGYCQIVLGRIAMRQGRLYRVALDIASRGAQNVTVIPRHDTSPWTVYVSSLEKASGEMHAIAFLGRGVRDADSVLLMLLMNGYTTRHGLIAHHGASTGRTEGGSEGLSPPGGRWGPPLIPLVGRQLPAWSAPAVVPRGGMDRGRGVGFPSQHSE